MIRLVSCLPLLKWDYDGKTDEDWKNGILEFFQNHVVLQRLLVRQRHLLQRLRHRIANIPEVKYFACAKYTPF